jgi:ABC-type glycerol-3-phosphate transport system permease component
MSFRSVQRRGRGRRVLLDISAWVILTLLALPAIWIILTAFRPASEVNASPPIWIPREITLDAFSTMFGLNPNTANAFPLRHTSPIP